MGERRPSARTAAIALAMGLNACVSGALAAVLPVVLTGDLGASYLAASLFMVAGTLASTVAIHRLGALADRPGLRLPVAFGAALCGFAGALALAGLGSYWASLAVFATLLAVAASLFPQLMAIAFVHDPAFAARARAIASAGWVIGPPIGGLLVSGQSREAFFLALAGAYALLLPLLLAAARGLAAPVPRSAAGRAAEKPPPIATPRGVGGAVLAVLATIHFLLGICALAVPWWIVEIGGSARDVGIAFAIAAAVEIPIIAGANAIRRRVGHARVVGAAAGLLAVYFITVALVESVPAVLAASLVHGAVTGAMMGTSLILLQERLPDEPGRASAIYSNMLRLSHVAALAAAGALAQWLSVAVIFWAAAGLALTTGVALAVLRPHANEVGDPENASRSAAAGGGGPSPRTGRGG
ncbi:MFS transporter [Salinarimonas chemoclinalis]|uniref:MFS transporter n=1 Tax=Salinarimonas chemoclinalis TaxID=3241599 RepID=UPI0035585546